MPDFYKENAIKHGYEHFDNGEMTPLDTYFCPYCSASDRERIYAYYIDLAFKKGVISKNSKFIHFSPEYSLKQYICNKFHVYETADISSNEVDHLINIENMPFQDESYDFFICSHVLEHVDDDDNAIQELYRILSKKGIGILMVPIALNLKNTFEDKSITSENLRWKYFGQNDHVRLYSRGDFVKKLKKHNFRVSLYDIDYFGKSLFSKMGLKETSILYIVSK